MRYFIAVAEDENFSRAAKRLGIVQPALTRQIQQLESELAVVLFERGGRGVRLTTEGRVFLDDARRTIGEAEHAVCRVQQARQGQIGTLVVGLTDVAIHIDAVPNILAEFKRRVPDVQLEIKSLSSIQQWAALRDRRISVGFMYFLPGDFPELCSRVIGMEQVVLLLPKRHRLAYKPKLRLRDLQDEPFVWYDPTTKTPYPERVLHACQAGGLVLRIVQEAPTEPTLLSFVARELGLSFGLASKVKQQKLTAVVLREVEDLDIEFTLHLVWRADDGSPVLRRFLDVLNEVDATSQAAVRSMTRRRTSRRAAG